MATYAPAQPAHVQAQQEKIKPMTNNKKDKEAPPSPPMKIRDQGNGLQYTRMGFLGEVSMRRGRESAKGKLMRLLCEGWIRESL